MMRLSLTLLILLVAIPARALDPAPVQDVPPGEDQIEAIMQGKPAPFTGQLFSPETALRWANWLTQYKFRLSQDVALANRICEARVEYKDRLMDIELERSFEVTKDLRARILKTEQHNAELNDEINDPSFWSSMEFGVILGVLGASAVAVAVGVAAASN